MTTLWFGEVAAGEPYHAALVYVPPRWQRRVVPHMHADFYELFCVVTGRGVHSVGETRLPLGTGDVVLVRPGDRHGFTGTNPEGLRFINIAFPRALWRAFTDVMAVALAQRWDSADLPPQLGSGKEDAVAAEFWRIFYSFHRRPRALDLSRLWSCILPAEDRLDGEEFARRPGWLTRATMAIAEEEHLRAGLPRLLQIASVSHGHLAREMRAHYGCTPVEYITEQRVAHAALLLTTTTESVSEIASRCGFSSVSYFGRRFRERYKTAPSRYRQTASHRVAPSGPPEASGPF